MMKLSKLAATAALIAVGAAGAVFADDIADRKAIMKNVGGAMGELGKIMKGEAEYDARVAVLAFRTMNAAALGIGSHFPEGTETGGETTVAPAIWSDRSGFQAALAKFQADTAAAIAAAPADKDAFQPVFGQVASNCKACHENYRVKKQ